MTRLATADKMRETRESTRAYPGATGLAATQAMCHQLRKNEGDR
jgi:hypothetical protein